MLHGGRCLCLREQGRLPRTQAAQRLHRARSILVRHFAIRHGDGVLQYAVQRIEILVASQHEQPVRCALENLKGSGLLLRVRHRRLVAHLLFHHVLSFPRPPLVPAQVRLYLFRRDRRL